MNKSILAIIITYNPEIQLLEKNISALSGQVDKVIVYDNNSSNHLLIESMMNKFDNTIYYHYEENLGLPVHYNEAIFYAKKNGYEWVLTMDQDTIVPPELVENYTKYISLPEIAIVSPVVFDINLDNYCDNDSFNDEITYIQYCISSASLVNVNIAHKIGLFDEKLFIDNVDFDFCKRVIDNNYKIIRVNNCVIKHQVGESRYIKLFNKKQIVFNHSAFRKYYFFRNRIYFAKKYNYSVVGNFKYFRNLFKYYLLIVFENDRIKKYVSATKGVIDGLKM